MTTPASLHHESLTALEWLTEPPIWLGDGKTLEAPGTFWGTAAVELLGAPSLLAGTSQTEAAAEQRRLAERIVRGLRTWENQGALELRYVWGDQPGRQHLRLLLIARAVGRQIEAARAWASQMLKSTVDLFPPGFTFGTMQASMPHDISAWAEIERTEEVRQPGPSVPPGAVGFYYLIHPLGGSGSGWPSLAQALSSSNKPGFLSIALTPTTMTDLERQAVDHVCSIAGYLAAPQQTYDFFGNPITNPADAGARAVELAWQRFPDRSGVLARIGVASTAQDLHRVTSLVGTVLTEGSDQSVNPLPTKFKILSDIGDLEAWQTATLGLVFPRARHPVWSLPDGQAPVTLERMPYFFSEQEAGGLFMLPVPDRQGVPGIPLSRQASKQRESIVANDESAVGVHLGAALHHGRRSNSVVLPLTAINRHALVVGAPGSGKTTTVLNMLVQLWCEHQIPFLVIESVKTEYRTLLGAAGLDDLRVITLGNESVAPLRLNPLEPPPGIRCEVHQSVIMASLKMALPLLPPQPELLAKALPETYYRAGWDDETTLADGLTAPTLRDLMNTYQTVFDKAGYEGEARNVARAFRVRLESLLQGSKGKLFDTVRSTDFAGLLARPTVIEMNDIVDADEKAVIAAFILDRMRAGAKRRGSTGGQLRHVTVLEEAHRLLAKANLGTGDALSGVQGKADSVRAFCEAIAETRSLGEGFILSSQSPAALADAAVANTGTRILHRMESAADRNVMLEDLDADIETRGIAARLNKGEAIVRWPERDEAELVQVDRDASIDSGRSVSDETVADHMRDHRRQTTHMLPYQLCTSEVCTTGCRSNVRRQGSQLAEEIGPSARDLWPEAKKRPGVELQIAALLREELKYDDLQLLYCGAVHLAINDDAFRPRPGRDERPLLIQIIRKAVNVE